MSIDQPLPIMGRVYKEIAMYLMNPMTGSVATLAEWQEIFSTVSPEEWGGPAFEDAQLVEVTPDGSGWWTEVQP